MLVLVILNKSCKICVFILSERRCTYYSSIMEKTQPIPYASQSFLNYLSQETLATQTSYGTDKLQATPQGSAPMHLLFKPRMR